MKLSNKIRYVEANGLGRDFVMGDVHGCFSLIEAALVLLHFDPAKDRLFSLGDLIDRGPESAQVAQFLQQPGIYGQRGNHEDHLLSLMGYDAARAAQVVPEAFTTAELNHLYDNFGLGWWFELSARQKQDIAEALLALPLLSEIHTPRGTVGLVHAEVPPGMGWAEFKEAIEAGDPAVRNAALWGRSRQRLNDASGVSGVGRIFCGHSIVNKVTALGNVYYLDTGAFLSAQFSNAGVLSLVDVMTKTAALTVRPDSLFVHLNLVDGPCSKTPYSVYHRE